MTPKPKLKSHVELSAEARDFWADVQDDYGIEDSAGLKLLGRACEALDRMRRAQKIIKREGEVIPDKKGSIKSNPAVAIEKEAHRQFLESLRMLNLDIEPAREEIGRPPGTSTPISIRKR